MNASRAILFFFFLAIVIPVVIAVDDQYKPYLHKPQVPEHPKVRLFGSYQTNLFPGAATYTYPIDVPPGTNGLQPSLTLMYNSQNAKSRPGILGASWELTQDYIIRNINGTPADKSDDFFTLVLNGRSEKLVVNGTELRTEIEYYARIQNMSGGENELGAYWLVTTKNGMQYRFGYTHDAELVSNVTNYYAAKWSLDQVRDTFGNTISFTYLESPHYPDDDGAVYLDRIAYNSDKLRVVRFGYEGTVRSDRRRVLREANPLEESRRLTSIEIVADGQLVRRYELTYLSLTTSLSSLQTIKQYGNDNTSLLHTVTFDYYGQQPGFTDHADKWIPPTIFSNNASQDFGVRILDINNDGFVDLLKGRETTSEKSAFINDKISNWTNSTMLVPPVYFVYGANDLDNGVRFADVNADGLLDILQSENNSGATKTVYLNNGTNWTNATSSWTIPIYFVNSDIDQGIDLVDVDGNGKVDLIKALNGTARTVYLNNGTGWTASAAWQFPADLISGNRDLGVRILDLNGDGLQDMLESSNFGASLKRAWLNNASGWIETSNWSPPIFFTTAARVDNGVRFADLNGDGLTDMIEDFENGSTTNRSVWLNTGSGWSLNTSWQSPEPFTQDGKNSGRRIADVNGDGMADIIVTIGNLSVTYGHTWTKNGTNPFLLKSITNEYGGVSQINYTPSTFFDNTGGDNVSDIGFAVQVVSRYAVNNSLNAPFNVTGVTLYSYLGGKYDAADVQFRGFSNVTETMTDGSIVKHYFHQSDALKGKEFKTEMFNDSLFSVSEMNYSAVFVLPNFKVELVSQSSSQYDGAATPFVTNNSYSYDPFSNVVEKHSFGDVANAEDDRIEKFTYEYSDTNHILDKVSSYKLFGEDNETVVKETRYTYDDGLLTRGAVTGVREWNSEGDDKVTHFTYDDFGNKASETNARGYTTTYEYGLREPTHTFLERMTNARGHVTEFSYDLGTGNLVWQKKNEITTYFTYDVHGRIEKEIKPYDSTSQPTKSYNYSFNGVAPENVYVTLRETGDATNRVLQYYYDGFAQVVQIKSQADDNKFITKNLYYDGLGRVSREDNPYFETLSTFTTPVNDTPSINYTYDALGRVVFVKNPDGTNKTVTFNRTFISDYDEKGHRHAYVLNGFGQIVNVLEYNNDPLLGVELAPYNTSYDYDTMGNLVQITDTLGNEFIFTYDSLGRKIALDDPDLGLWTYDYDSLGNLVEQVDARGKIINLHYDALNRVVKKNTSDSNTTFAYDAQFQGALSNVSIGNKSIRYTYDDRMRIVKEEALRRGMWFVTNRTYDSMDRIVEQQLPGYELEYFYSKRGKVRQISGYVSNASYNAFGSLVNRTLGNGLTMRYTYSSLNNRLTRMSTGLIQDLNYEYDGVGNLLSINESISNRVHQMSYDNLDRLVTATLSGDLYRYEYSPLGNILRTQENGVVKRYQYEGAQAHAPSAIDTRSVGAQVHDLKDVETHSKTRVYEFYVINETSNATTTNWSLNVNGTPLVSTQLNVTSPVLVLVEYNHSVGGDYWINVTTRNDTVSGDAKFGLLADELDILSRNVTVTISEFDIQNDVNQSITGVNWTCGGVSSSQLMNISGRQTLFVLVETNQSSAGEMTLNCSAQSNDGSDSKTDSTNILGLAIEAYQLLSRNINSKIAMFDVRNYFYATNPAWNMSTGEQVVGTANATIGTNAFIMVIEEFNYTNDTLKNISIAVAAPQLNDSMRDRQLLEALKLENYDRYDDNSSTQVFWFDLNNNWIANLSVQWNATSPSLSNASNISQNGTLMVFIQEGFNAGEKQPIFNTEASNFRDSVLDIFTISPIDVLQYGILRQAQNSTIAEFNVRNNDNITNVSWSVNTGTATITATNKTTLNKTQSLFVFVETNYTSAGVYATAGIANSSSARDNSSGVAVV